MKCKRVLVSIVFMLCFAAIAPAFASPTMIYLEPSSYEYEPGEEFTVTLKIDGVADLYLWTVTIEWDAALVELVGNPVEGDCLKDPDALCGGPYATSFITPTEPGKISEMVCTRLGDFPGANVPPCTDDLASMTFRVLNATPVCTYFNISITFHDLMNSEGATIECTVEDGQYHVIPEFAVAILGLGAMFGALGVYRYRRKTN